MYCDPTKSTGGDRDEAYYSDRVYGERENLPGSRLAKAMKRSFVDTDERIVKESGMTVEEIFRQEGEVGFRRRETESLRKFF